MHRQCDPMNRCSKLNNTFLDGRQIRRTSNRRFCVTLYVSSLAYFPGHFTRFLRESPKTWVVDWIFRKMIRNLGRCRKCVASPTWQKQLPQTWQPPECLNLVGGCRSEFQPFKDNRIYPLALFRSSLNNR